MVKPWEMCVIQKQLLTKTICVNVIFRALDANSLLIGAMAAFQFQEIVSSEENIATCCPFIKLIIHFTPIDEAHWKKNIEKEFGKALSEDVDAELLQIELSLPDVNENPDSELSFIKSNCINVMAFPIKFKEGTNPAGFTVKDPTLIVIDPESFTAEENVIGAHEFGHALGLPDTDEVGRVMLGINIFPGKKFDKGECEGLWKGIPSYEVP